MQRDKQASSVKHAYPPKMPRAVAGVGVFIAGLLVLFGIALVTFAQIIPAIIVFALAVPLGLVSGAELRKKVPPGARGGGAPEQQAR